MPAPLSRREFLATSLAAGAATACASTLPARAGEAGPRFTPIVFTKPFAPLDYDRTAELVAEMGFAGIECPVRNSNQIKPDQVEGELPKMHEALRRRGLELSVITTEVRRRDPLAERVLRAGAQLGVKRFRLAFVHYDLNKPLLPQLAEWKAELRDVAALARELGVQCGIQNHSGSKYIGAPIWDIHELVRDLDPAHLGICFDIGHATLEGGLSWPIESRLMQPYFTAIFVKDFVWEKGPKGWKDRWVPLGEGMVRKEFFDWLKTTPYRGPVSQHFEYFDQVGPAEVAQMKKDLRVLKGWLGLPA